MDHIVPIFLMCIAACSTEPLNEAFRRRAPYSMYTDDLSEEYEPVAVATFPLRQPVQLLRLLSPSTFGSNFAQYPKRSIPRIPPQPQHDYRDHYRDQYRDQHREQYAYAATSEPEYTYSYEDDYDEPSYASSSTQSKHKYSNPASYEEYESTAPAPIVLYARPNKNGGYTYRQKPRPATKPQEPVIIRVQKYKLVRD